MSCENAKMIRNSMFAGVIEYNLVALKGRIINFLAINQEQLMTYGPRIEMVNTE